TAARREGARARAAQSGADREDSEAAQQGSGPVLAPARWSTRAPGCERAGAWPRAPPGRPLGAPGRGALVPGASRPHARRAAPADRAHPRQSDEQHEPDPLVRGGRQEASLPWRCADRELELLPARTPEPAQAT